MSRHAARRPFLPTAPRFLAVAVPLCFVVGGLGALFVMAVVDR